MDMRDDKQTYIMVFSAKLSEVAPSEASSQKRQPKTATTISTIKKQDKSKAVRRIEGPEIRQLLSPLPISPVMQTISTTLITRPVQMESADDTSATSYISSHNIGVSD